jgi:hypothetical protein
VKHAGRGELLYRLSKNKPQPVFEILSIDNGKGIKDLNLMIRDGISSTNTLGHGLGSIMRLSNYAQVYSQPGWGTVVYSQVCSGLADDVPEDRDASLTIAALSVCKPGETYCGDGYDVRKAGTRTKIFFGDGLGHGEHAHYAVSEAIRSFEVHSKETDQPAEMLRDIHYDVKRTRGLVASIVILNPKEKIIRFCGVGNISTRIYNGIVGRNNVSYNGIIGLNIPTTLNSTDMPMDKSQTLVMCSDGLKTRWEIAQYPGLLKYDPMVIAAVIYKDQARKTDDMSVLVARIK